MNSVVQKQQEEDQFGAVFTDTIADSERTPEEKNRDAIVHEFVTPLGETLRKWFCDFQRDRDWTEQRWLKDLRQFRGEYDREVLAKMKKNRSRANLSLTRAKVRTITSRMTDLLMPASTEKNWGIEITPVPELNPEMVTSISDQYTTATGQAITPEEIERLIHVEAKARCDRMEKEIEDQLVELKWHEAVRKVIFSGNLYGTGVLKGPTVYTKVAERWLPRPDNGAWVNVKISRKLPYFEFVPVWDIYPDMTALQPEDMRGIFQRHLMAKHQVFALTNRKDFNRAGILAYLEAYPGGDADVKTHETELRNINRDFGEGTSVDYTSVKKYEVLEFWGYVSSDELEQAGVVVPKEAKGTTVFINAWLLGSLLIKVVISSIEGAEYLYHFYHYEKDDTSIFGEGIPAIMRDPQKLFNASIRAMLDNAAIAAGPLVEVNQDLLPPEEDARKLYPFRVYVREGLGSDAMAPAVRVFKVPSYTREYMEMVTMFMNLTDEVTAIPRYLYGDSNQVGGAGRTATGLSMLMGASNITLKDQVRNYDDGITKRFIRAMYHWNMRFSPKEDIKGDYQVVAKGSSSLIAREVQIENLLKFLQVTDNPTDHVYTKRANIFKEFAKALDLSKLDVVEDQAVADQKLAQMADQQKRQEDMKIMLDMIKAQSGGHMEEQSNRPRLQRLTPQQLEQGEIPEVG